MCLFNLGAGLLNIRNAHLDDVNHIHAIQASCYEIQYLEHANSFASKINKAAQSCWIAEMNGHVIAYLICLPVNAHTFPALNASKFEQCDTPTLLYLHDLAVHADYRDVGAGQQLIKHALDFAKQQHFDHIGLVAVQGSTKYWQKQGFEVRSAMLYGLNKKVASFGTDAVFMQQQL